MSDPSRAEMIDYLVNTRVPRMDATSVWITEKGFVHSALLKQTAAALREELSALDGESVKARYDAFVTTMHKHLEAREAAHSFNQPYGRADFDQWAKMEYWTVDEGIALLLGRSPTVLVWDKVQNVASPVVLQFARIREAAQRAVNWKTLHAGNRPGAFIAWAKRFEHPVPAELEEKVQKFGHFMGDWYSNYQQLEKNYDALKEQYDANLNEMKQTYDGIVAGWKKQCESLSEGSTKNHKTALALIQQRDDKIAELQAQVDQLKKEPKAAPKEKSLGQREGDTLRKLVIGLAMVAYAYDPRAARSEVAAEIVRDLELRGLAISDDTVRKHLRESAELLPQADAPEQKLRKS